MKLRIYLDTSVFSARFDDASPERKALTTDFWHAADQYLVSTSVMASAELERSSSADLRSGLAELLRAVKVIPVTDEMKALARWYVEVGVFSPLYITDAMHVAACVLGRQEILLSWDFKRLVNRRCRFLVNETNASADLPRIEILPPPEL